jgi:hypothetical protein
MEVDTFHYLHLQPVASLRRSACSDAPCPSSLASPPHAPPNRPQPIPRLHLPHLRHGSLLPLHRRWIPPLDLQAAIALVRLHCRLPPSLPPLLFRLSTSYPPSPSSLEAAMQSAHAKLLQRHLWLSFTLPPRLACVTKPINIERAYARFLRPAVSSLSRQSILHPAPATPTTTGTPISFAYTTLTSSARTCTASHSTSASSRH